MILKVVLGLSLVLNGVLGYFLWKKDDVRPPLERIVIETHPAPDGRERESGDHAAENRRMNEERLDFFADELGLTTDQIESYQRIRNNYLDGIQDRAEPFKSPSVDDLKKFEASEKEMLKELEKLFGRDKWERYARFRDNFNKKSWERHQREKLPFVRMEI